MHKLRSILLVFVWSKYYFVGHDSFWHGMAWDI